jgi:WD40 repeat protein
MTATNRAKQPLGQPEPFIALSFSPDGELAATSTDAKHSMLWTVRTGDAQPVPRDHTDREVRCVAFSPAGPILATTGSDHTVSLVDLITGSQRLAIDGPSLSIGSLTFSPDGGLLVGEGNDGVVHIWDTKTGKELHVLTQTGHVPSPGSVAISPDGRTLALQTGGRVTCWHPATGVPRDLWTRDMRGVNCLAYSPDGRTFATGAIDRRRITLWDTSTGRERASLGGGRGAICSLAFSPDGRTLASGSEGGEVKLWDAATAQELISLVGHTGAVNCAAFSPDGNTLATAGTSADRRRGEIKFWRAEAAGLLGIEAKPKPRDILGLRLTPHP